MAIFKIDIPGLTGKVSPEEFAFISEVKVKILENMGNPLFGSHELSEALGLANNQMSRKFKGITTCTPARMIRHFRMEYAMVLLKETRAPIKEVTVMTGFLEQANFARTFKNHFGRSPSEVRAPKRLKPDAFTYKCSSPMKGEDLKYITWLANDRPWFKTLLKATLSNLHDEQFNVDKLAGALSVSSSQMNRKLNELLNISASRFIKNMRLQYAAELLSFKNDAVGTIAFQVGFFDHPHFCRVFKEAYQCAPKAFRANGKKKQTSPFITNYLSLRKTDN